MRFFKTFAFLTTCTSLLVSTPTVRSYIYTNYVQEPKWFQKLDKYVPAPISYNNFSLLRKYIINRNRTEEVFQYLVDNRKEELKKLDGESVDRLLSQSTDEFVRYYIERVKPVCVLRGTCIYRLLDRYMREDNADMIDFLVKLKVPFTYYYEKKGKSSCAILIKSEKIAELMKQYMKDDVSCSTCHEYLIDRAAHGDISALKTVMDDTNIWNRRTIYEGIEDDDYWYIFYRQLLHSAGSNGYVDVVQYMIDKLRTSNETVLRVPIHYDYSNVWDFENYRESARKIENLYRYGYGYFDKEDPCVIMSLVHFRNIELLSKYMAEGFDIHAQEELALRTAVCYNYTDIATFLLEQGANPNIAPVKNPLIEVDFETRDEILDDLPMGVSFIVDITSKHYLLHICDNRRFTNMAQILIQYGAKVNK